MKIRLGILTTKAHVGYLQTIEKEFRSNCHTRFFVINDPREARDTYLKYAGSVDGFVFSGRFLYEAVGQEHIDDKLPTRILQDDELILYRELFRLLITEPGLDVSRIYVDFAYVLDSFHEFQQYLTQQGKPIDSDDPFEKMATMLENHIALWRENKIDLSITAFGHFIPALKRHGIRHIFIQPSFEHMREIISGIIDEITIKKLKSRRAVVAWVVAEATQDEGQLLELKRQTGAFLREVNLADTAQVSDGLVRLYTTHGDFLKITTDAQDCALLRALEERQSSDVKIGWGQGKEYYQANQNAMRAFKQAKAYAGSCSFFVSEELKVIGPMRSADAMHFSEQGEPEIVALSHEIGMNNINLQKIISYAKIIGTNKLSSEDVARCLSITVRGANRILNKIEGKGFAEAIFEKRESGKGRPQKYYKLSFLDNQGERLMEAPPVEEQTPR